MQTNAAEQGRSSPVIKKLRRSGSSWKIKVQKVQSTRKKQWMKLQVFVVTMIQPTQSQSHKSHKSRIKKMQRTT